MSNVTAISVLVWSVIAAWSTLGVIYYLTFNDKVVLRLQRAVLSLVGGPFVWMFKLFIFVFGSLLYTIELSLEKFEQWLVKTQHD